MPLRRANAPVDVLNYEIVQEQAAALGRLGRSLEAALKALREFDAAHPRSSASYGERQARRVLVSAASQALWMFVVQREACGLRDSRSRRGAGADGGVSTDTLVGSESAIEKGNREGMVRHAPPARA